MLPEYYSAYPSSEEKESALLYPTDQVNNRSNERDLLDEILNIIQTPSSSWNNPFKNRKKLSSSRNTTTHRSHDDHSRHKMTASTVSSHQITTHFPSNSSINLFGTPLMNNKRNNNDNNNDNNDNDDDDGVVPDTWSKSPFSRLSLPEAHFTMNKTNMNKSNDSLPMTIKDLVPMPILACAQHPQNRAVFFFDWDDTLFPSSHEARRKSELPADGRLTPVNYEQELKKLSDIVIQLLTQAALLGSVFIVTGSEHGWVKQSCQESLPEVWAMIKNLPIVSARTLYESKAPNDVYHWKYRAFEDCLTPHHQHILSFGDNPNDAKVPWDLGKLLPHVSTIKTVLLTSNPDIVQLRTQLYQLLQSLMDIYRYPLSHQWMMKLINE